MSKLLISYVNDWAAGTVTASSQHPSFLAVNTQHRWFKKVYRSKYGAGSNWGRFNFAVAARWIYFNEGGASLSCAIALGVYDTATVCAQIKTKMETVGALTYTATYSDTTNKIAIAASGPFVLELSETTNSAMPALGWTTIVDTASLASHTAEAIRIHTSELLYCDLGSTKTIREIIIKNHNLQSSAVVTVNLYSDAFITLVDWIALTHHDGQIGISTAKSVRYISIEVADRSNPDGYIEIGLVWMGDATQLHYGFTMDRSETPEDPSIESESDDGQASTIQLSKYKGWTYTFDAVKPTDRTKLLAVFEEIGKTRPCFLVEVPPVFNLIYVAESSDEKIVDGGMEIWASATNLTSWTESIAGTSTINREATTKHRGSYSCRMDIDALDSTAYIYQNITLTANSNYKLSFWHNISVGKTGRFAIYETVGSQYLQADGSWAAGVYYFDLVGTGAWTNYTLNFISHPTVTATRLIIRDNSSASSSLYFDDVSILPALTASDIGTRAKYVKLPGWEWAHVAGLYWGLDLEIKQER